MNALTNLNLFADAGCLSVVLFCLDKSHESYLKSYRTSAFILTGETSCIKAVTGKFLDTSELIIGRLSQQQQ